MKLCLIALAPLLAVGCALSANPNSEGDDNSAAAVSAPAAQTISADPSPIYGQLDDIVDVHAVDAPNLDLHLITLQGELYLSATHVREGHIFDLGAASSITSATFSEDTSDLALTTANGTSSVFVQTTDRVVLTPEGADSTPIAPATDEALDELTELETMQSGTTPSGTQVRLFDMAGDYSGDLDHLLIHIGSGAQAKTYDLGIKHVDHLDHMTVLDDGTARIVGSTTDGNFVYTIAFKMAGNAAPATIALTRTM